MLPMIIDIDCPLCRGEGRIETGEMESGPAVFGAALAALIIALAAIVLLFTLIIGLFKIIGAWAILAVIALMVVGAVELARWIDS